MPFLQTSERVKHQGDAGFHVEDGGSSQLVVPDAAGHGGERSQRIDRVVVAEQQYRLRGGLAHRLSWRVKVDLQVIAEVFRWMDSRLAAELGKFMRDGLRNAVHG